MGTADVIPGVSGGTVALIVGIYEDLVASIRAAAAAAVVLLRGDRAGARARLAQVHWGLVVPLAAGILTALVIGAKVIPYLLATYPVAMLAVFFGLLGVIMVFLRTRYTVALYLVIFGSIVVAAYKMGMVHERPSSGPPGGLGDGTSSATPTISEDTVLDVEDPENADRTSSVPVA